MGNMETKIIWEDFSVSLKRFISKRVRDEYDAEDILQDIFCKIHDHLGELRDNSKLHSWVYQITRNTIIDYYRNNNETVELTDLPDFKADFLATDMYQELGYCLKAMILHLPEKYREAIHLTEYDHLTQKELAERLGLSISGAKSRVQRARSKLRAVMLGCCHVEFDRLGNISDYRQKNKDCKFC